MSVTEPTSSTPIPILYTGHLGRTGVIWIVPGPAWFGSTEEYPEQQWLLTADEPNTGKRRDFAFSGIKAWGEDAIAAMESLDADVEVMRIGLRLAAMRPTDPRTLARVRQAATIGNAVPGPSDGWPSKRIFEPASGSA